MLNFYKPPAFRFGEGAHKRRQTAATVCPTTLASRNQTRHADSLPLTNLDLSVRRPKHVLLHFKFLAASDVLETEPRPRGSGNARSCLVAAQAALYYYISNSLLLATTLSGSWKPEPCRYRARCRNRATERKRRQNESGGHW